MKVPECVCYEDTRLVIDVTGGSGLERKHGKSYKGSVAEAAEAMEIDWMVRTELVDAIPPAYTELIGRELNSYLTELS